MNHPRERQAVRHATVPGNVLGAVGLVFGVAAVCAAWAPTKAFTVPALAVAAVVIGAVGTYRSVSSKTGFPFVFHAATWLGAAALAIPLVDEEVPDGAGTPPSGGDENYRMRSRTPTGSPPTEPSRPAEDSPPSPREITDGTWVVGEDLAPGTYRTAGPADGEFGFCTWERLEELRPEGPPVIAGNMVADSVTVTIEPGDGVFETHGCRPWVRVRP